MKARHIKKLRKKISKSGYHQKRLELFKEKLKEWRHFQQFECVEFFRGEELANHNQSIYDKEQPRDVKKFNYYVNKIKELEKSHHFYIETLTKQNGEKLYRAKVIKSNNPKDFKYINKEGFTISIGIETFNHEKDAVNAIEEYKKRINERFEHKIIKVEDKRYGK
jgi:hypothetical protein